MSRKPRIRMPEITYHITSRCIEKKPLMKPAYFKDLMLTVLNQALKKYTFELSGYTLMNNHFHLCIRTVNQGEDISRIMQFIKAQFARKYNRILNRTGPFWNERFSDRIIETSDNPLESYKNVHMYMGYNPVRSGYVRDPRDYKYSSFNCYIHENYFLPVMVTRHPYFSNLGSTFKECAQVILDFEDEYRRQIFMMEKVV
jgi:putative transposase